MGDALERDEPRTPAGEDEGHGREVTGIHLRSPRPRAPEPAGRAAPPRPYSGVVALVLKPEGSGQRAYRLGMRPGRRLAWIALGWLLLMASAGASLRWAGFEAKTPLHLGWSRVRDEASTALPLTGWARRPEARWTPSSPERARERAQALGLGSRRVASELLRGEVDRRWVREAARLGQTPSRFLWPVARGWFVRGFGSGTGGYHLAVDVAGEEGSTVRAAADGLVAYADDGVRGFGNLLMLVHGGGFVTMYAHNQTNEVSPGEFVRSGAPIATLGNTGISRGPHVHFELIHERRNCDPVPLFEPGVRHRDSGFDTSRQTRWQDGRPRGVRCERRRRHPHSRWGADGEPGETAANAPDAENIEPASEKAHASPAAGASASAGPAHRGRERREEREEREEPRGRPATRERAAREAKTSGEEAASAADREPAQTARRAPRAQPDDAPPPPEPAASLAKRPEEQTLAEGPSAPAPAGVEPAAKPASAPSAAEVE